MANKKEVKNSERRILIYLAQVRIADRFKMKICTKLDMDYGYVTKILAIMLEKGWVTIKRGYSTHKLFYSVSDKGQKMKVKANG